VEVKGFPTIVFFDAKEGEGPEAYSGGRDLDALVEFVEKKTGLKAGSAPAEEEKEDKEKKHEEL